MLSLLKAKDEEWAAGKGRKLQPETDARGGEKGGLGATFGILGKDQTLSVNISPNYLRSPGCSSEEGKASERPR